MKITKHALALALGLIALAAPNEVRANSVTDNFSGTLASSFNGSDAVTGQFTLDTTTATISAFDFSVPGIRVQEITGNLWTPAVFAYTPAINPVEDFVEIEFKPVFAGAGDLILIFQSDLSNFTGTNFDANPIQTSQGVVQAQYSCSNLIVCGGVFNSTFSAGAAVPTPEPFSLLLLGTGLLSLTGSTLRRRRA